MLLQKMEKKKKKKKNNIFKMKGSDELNCNIKIICYVFDEEF